MATETTHRKAKIWNRNSEDYSQIVKGEKVHIPKGKSITVSRRQALDIRGHYPGKGVVTKLEIEPILEKVEVDEQWVDHRTGKIYPTKDSLLRHLGVDPALASKPKGFECVICGEECETKDELVAHLAKCVPEHAPKQEAAAKK